MSLKSKHSRDIGQIYHNLHLYNKTENDWVSIKPLEVGDLKYSIRSDDHNQWMNCDGRSLIREKYPRLFEIIGTAFGNDSSTTFNLPDCRGRILGSVGQGVGLTARTTGQLIGSETHTLNVAEMPSHIHTGTTDSSGSHTHTSNAIGGQGNLGLVSANGNNTVIDTDSSSGELNVWTTPQALTINSSGTHIHNFTTGSTGSGTAFNIMQPTLFIGNVFIYTGDI